MNVTRWGVLSTSDFAQRKVIPAMKQCEHAELTAIASRSLERARAVAQHFGIAKAYGSYEELLADSDIDVIYNPLPNHMHVEWSVKALEAGKHVICEKPIGLSSLEVHQLLQASQRRPNQKVMEGFMYRCHPQWQRARQLVAEGQIGELRTISSIFSYYNADGHNIRNQPETGGGGIWDIGCYCVSLSRFIFGDEPARVLGILEFDPQFKTDRLASGILDFGRGTATFTCSTQLSWYQRVNIFGTTGRVEIELPFNPPPDKPAKVWLHKANEIAEIIFDLCDQYTIQGDLFSLCVVNQTPVPYPLEDSAANIKVIEAVIESSKRRSWV